MGSQRIGHNCTTFAYYKKTMFSVASTAFYTAWNNLYTCGNNLYIFLLHFFNWKMEFRKCWQPASISESNSKGKASPYLPDGDQRLGRIERSQCIWWWTNQFHCNLRHFWLTNNLYMCVCVCVCVCVSHTVRLMVSQEASECTIW